MKEKLLRLGSYMLVTMLTTVLTSLGTLTIADYKMGLKPSKLEQLEMLIQEKYIGEVDKDTLLDAAADAMVNATGDRWSYYIPADKYASYQERRDNAYVGVGISIQLAGEAEGFLVTEVTDGSPAEEAGLQIGDLLIGVEDMDVRGVAITDVHSLVRGEEGSYVIMKILRKGENMNFTVERRRMQTPVATGTMLDDGIGLVTIRNFDTRCAQETIDIIESLRKEGAEKLIFDVRYNPGGFASELVDLLDYLLPEGELFRVNYYDGREEVDTSDVACLDMPMAVLVNASSYSAAEFFAAALREYEAAITVGEQTVGKGYCQATYTLSDGSAVAMSIGEYVTPKGFSLAGVGLLPDLLVPVDAETAFGIYTKTLKPEEDPQIRAAIQALK